MKECALLLKLGESLCRDGGACTVERVDNETESCRRVLFCLDTGKGVCSGVKESTACTCSYVRRELFEVPEVLEGVGLYGLLSCNGASRGCWSSGLLESGS